MTKEGSVSKQLILGIDGGATKTNWVLCENGGKVLHPVKEGKAGPGSMKLLTREELRHLLASLPQTAARVGVYLAGCATEQDRRILREVATEVWPGAAIAAGSDRDCGYAAAFGKGDGIAVISGTGSAVTGRKGGQEDRAGGWGHLLGDTGGGYDLAIHALRRVLFDYDTGHRITPLGRDVLRTLGLNTLRELSGWAQSARKGDLARLTPLLFAHAQETEAREILRDGASALADLALAVARRLELTRPTVRLMGGVFLKQPLYVKMFAEAFLEAQPGADVAVTENSASLGAALLAAEAETVAPGAREEFHEPHLDHAETEQANARSTNLDKLATADLVTLFLDEENQVEQALRKSQAEIIAAVEVIAAALKNGGRLFYAGAGTSGRLGVLDASEMPPTFGVAPEMVQGIMAGGYTALQNSVEGAEDDTEAGERVVTDRGIGSADVVCGITASGRTPFVGAVLAAARAKGTRTILLTCNPKRQRGRICADVEIDLATGPELITGSTRLKAGTATKVTLNILSSCAMIRLGRVEGNFMARLQPTNDKLRHRAARIVASRLGVSETEAKERLKCSNWNIERVLTAAAEKR